MGKKSKHPRYDDPTAFGMKWPTIREITDGSLRSPIEMISKPRYFQMGKVKAILNEPTERTPYFLSVRCNNRYPTWDEIVWLRYSLIPDSAIMALILPNLNRYINQDDTEYRFVFTMEQNAWALDPAPRCERCQADMQVEQSSWIADLLRCEKCGTEQPIDFRAWNEAHGNGLKGVG